MWTIEGNHDYVWYLVVLCLWCIYCARVCAFRGNFLFFVLCGIVLCSIPFCGIVSTGCACGIVTVWYVRLCYCVYGLLCVWYGDCVV